MSIAGGRAQPLTNQDSLFWRVHVLSSPQRAGGMVVILQLWGTSSKRDREEWMLLGGTPPASASLPYLLNLRHVATSPSPIYSLPFCQFRSQALPSAFPHTSKQTSGEIRLVETWGPSVNSQGNEPSRKIF